MGSKRPPLVGHTESTLFLRVPLDDWVRVKLGEKRQFRMRPREGRNLYKGDLPTPVVAYTEDTIGRHEMKLMVLLECRHEPLFNITEREGDVEEEGFASYDEFRSYWRRRRGGAYFPMEMVYVWRVRPWEPGDDAELGGRLLERLYGGYR